MSHTILDRSFPELGSAIGGDAPLAVRAADAQPLPRVVTTGRKVVDQSHPLDEETGERLRIVTFGEGRSKVERHLFPDPSASPGVAIVDALAFSVVPPEDKSYVWVLEQMSQFLDLGNVVPRRGAFGFRYSAHFGDGAGMLAWGGDSQRGRVYFSLMGQGCSMVTDWSRLSTWLQQHRAVIKRADVAYDDFAGDVVSIAWAVQQYHDDGFNAGGRKPSHSVYGDWLHGEESTKGRTLGIGNRASGKFARIYEKGKQLGDASSPWTRIEVEWRAQDRFIPFDILTRPGHYLAGAYPCLAFLAEEQSTIKTIAKAAQIAFDAAVDNAKRSCGKLVNLLLDVVGGDYVEVVTRLARPGYPSRVDPYSYHVKRNPAMLDMAAQGGPA